VLTVDHRFALSNPAWDMVIQANSLFWRLTKAEDEAAIAILKQAVERYPDYAPARSMLAFMMLVSGYVGWALREPQLQQAAGLAIRAEELDHGDPWAHLALGYVAFVRRRTSVATAEFQRALALNPNFAAAHGYLGWALAFCGLAYLAPDIVETIIDGRQPRANELVGF
jgi:tetratricopeptide (TPR) repeat protein